MLKAFVNMVLTEEDEIVVPLCLIVIALAMQHLNGPRIIRSCWTRRWIQRRTVYPGARHALLEELRNEHPKSLKNFLKMDLQTFDPFLNCVYTFAGITPTFRNSRAVIG